MALPLMKYYLWKAIILELRPYVTTKILAA